MSQGTDDARAAERHVGGFALGSRQATGHPDGWVVPRDGDSDRVVKLPPRGTVRGDWDALARDDADGW